MPPDIRYFITFVLGMGGFWLSGAAASHLPHQANHSLGQLLAALTTAAVYGGLLAIWTVITSRGFNWKRVLVAVGPAVVLAYSSAQLITRLAAGKITNVTSLGVLTFGLFVCYGLIYVLSLALARRLVH